MNDQMGNWYDDARLWVSDRIEDISETVDNFSDEWDKKVAELKSKAKEFSQLFQKLWARRELAQKDPAIAAEYNALMNKGETVKNTVQSTLNKIDGIARLNPFSMGGMGAVALVPIAVIVVALAALTGWLDRARPMNNKLEFIEARIAEGMSYEDAVALYNKTENKGFSLGVGGMIVLGVATYFFLPTIKKKLLR